MTQADSNSAPLSSGNTEKEAGFLPSPLAIDAGRVATGATPDPDWTDLRRAISAIYGIAPDHILCGTAMAGLILALLHTTVGKGQVVLGSSFGNHLAAEACVQAQGVFVAAEEAGYAVSVEHVLRQVTPQTRMVFLSNPGPLTGTFITGNKLIELRGELPDEVLLVVDQAQGEFGDVAQNRGLLFPLVEAGNTVILRDLSGAYGLPGVPVAWGYFPPAIAAGMRSLLVPGDLSAATQAMSVAAMQDQTHMQHNVQQIGEIRDRFAADLRRIGIRVPPGYADFVLLQFESDQIAQEVQQMLRARGLELAHMQVAGLTHCLRAPIASREVAGRILSALSGSA